MAFQTVTPAQGRVAPSSSDKCAGIFTAPSSSNTAFSASMPSMPPPSALVWTSAGASPPTQRWKKHPATRSLTFTRVNTGVDLDDLPRAVRQRNEVLAHRHSVSAAHNAEIAEIERAGLNFHHDLSI